MFHLESFAAIFLHRFIVLYRYRSQVFLSGNKESIPRRYILLIPQPFRVHLNNVIYRVNEAIIDRIANGWLMEKKILQIPTIYIYITGFYYIKAEV